MHNKDAADREIDEESINGSREQVKT